MAEIQALLAPTAYGNARRSSNGFDFGRAAMLLAVLEKRGGLKVSVCDAYLNIIGGLNLDEPAADLAAVLALLSLTEALNPLVFFLGYMSLKVTAYLQPITHKLCNKLFREEDPVPLSEEELAAQEGETPAS